ncbi:DNA-binding transcriptional regulator YhcF (GntR family) [Gelidibacter algens]|uniref:DNA-binding transcriptional regulator YhcF (GntR family) n=1 Tax=Gelidibacter algens TaxID=49280 RepID=A0A1A7R688_9FLAO|nr:GntR family transcriptional regulator [Gelidibacter algens]OBX27013.1 GntR family transcriptional regulator [Gelidibacter algens]RAJ28046.1 DNA-binding transcriptional regulator YhcF (GntR family) [Gelidibacter algens]
MKNNLSLNIDHDSDTPKYQQIVNAINDSISKDLISIGYTLPSVNSICKDCKLSRDTVFKAYSILKDAGVIEAVPNKGYYVASKTKKVLLVLDTLKAYKEVLYHSFTNNLPDTIITDVQFHHYNIDNFKTIINNNIGKYYKYVVMGFDNKTIPSILSKISDDKLLLIDWKINATKENNYVYQDFGPSFLNSLEQGLELFKKYKEIHFLYPSFTNHPIETVEYFKKFCKKNQFDFKMITNSKEFNVERNVAYISVSDRMLGLFLEQCRDKEFEPGVDVGFLSYNETPMKKFIYKGITVVSTDFKELGTKAAEFIMEDKQIQYLVPTKLIIRDSL